MMIRWQTSFLAALLVCLIVSNGPAQQTPFALPPVRSDSNAPKSLDDIVLSGLETIPPELIRHKLANLPEVVEALHPSIDTTTFHHRVGEAIKRGFVSSGFIDCKLSFETDSDSAPTMTIVEGPRFRRGEIRVTGASETANRWLTDKLIDLETTGKKPERVWQTDKPFSGSLVAQTELAGKIFDCLSANGLSRADADVQLVRAVEKLRVDMVIRLTKQNTLWIPPIPEPAIKSTGQVLPLATTKESKADLLDRIYQQHFAKPRTGCIVVTRDDATETRIGFGSQQTYGEIFRDIAHPKEKRQQGVCVVFQGNESLITANQVSSRDDIPATTWRLPSLRFGFILKQQGVAESKGANALNLTFNWETLSDEQDAKPLPSGFHFTLLGWQEWFPAESTKISTTDAATRLSFGNRELMLDENGDFVSLRGLSANGSPLEIQAATDEQIKAARRSPISAPDAKDIFVRDRVSGKKIALAEVVDNSFPNNKDQHEFFIPSANGQKGIWGALILMLVNEENFVEKDSLVGELATLYALQLSGYPRTLSERMDEIQIDAMDSPISSFALADIAQRSGQLDRAVKLYKNAWFISQHDRAVRRDVNLILDDASLLGQITRSIDIKSLLQLGLRLSAASSKIDVEMVQTMLSMMPDADSEIARRDNCRLVARFLYEAKMHATLRKTCESRLQAIQDKQRKVAAKAKKKKDDKAKKAAKKPQQLRQSS
ncbi:MAG: hypothetical protein WBD20_14135 [Pirellulaceae bacterium]